MAQVARLKRRIRDYYDLNNPSVWRFADIFVIPETSITENGVVHARLPDGTPIARTIETTIEGDGSVDVGRGSDVAANQASIVASEVRIAKLEADLVAVTPDPASGVLSDEITNQINDLQTQINSEKAKLADLTDEAARLDGVDKQEAVDRAAGDQDAADLMELVSRKQTTIRPISSATHTNYVSELAIATLFNSLPPKPLIYTSFEGANGANGKPMLPNQRFIVGVGSNFAGEYINHSNATVSFATNSMSITNLTYEDEDKADDIDDWKPDETSLPVGALRKFFDGASIIILGRTVLDVTADGGTVPPLDKWQDVTKQLTEDLTIIDSDTATKPFFCVYGGPHSKRYQVTGSAAQGLIFPSDGGASSGQSAMVLSKSSAVITVEGKSIPPGNGAMVTADGGTDGPHVVIWGGSSDGSTDVVLTDFDQRFNTGSLHQGTTSNSAADYYAPNIIIDLLKGEVSLEVTVKQDTQNLEHGTRTGGELDILDPSDNLVERFTVDSFMWDHWLPARIPISLSFSVAVAGQYKIRWKNFGGGGAGKRFTYSGRIHGTVANYT